MTDDELPVGEQQSDGAAAEQPTPSTPRPGAQAASRARRIGGRPMPGPRPTPGPDHPTPTGRPASALDAPPVDTTDARADTKAEKARLKAEQAQAKADRRAEERAERLIAQEGRPVGRWLLWFPAMVAGALLVAMIVITVWQAKGAWYDKPSTSAPTQLRTQVLAAAKSCGAAVTSYDYRKFAQAEQAGIACTTGKFTDDYKAAMEQTVKPLAAQSQTVQTTQIAKAGVQSVSPDGKQWVILVFGQQSVTNKVTGPNSPRLDQLSMQVTVTKVGSRWLVSSFQSVS